ncbi:type II secretion system protein [Mariniblastus fucicola]|uniref:Type II secretion system protein G n=1 Tax=Mariniblastus fucicola TaxID=980251 RepID=A0A5B9P7P4_9BACT|nr:type II secretion system protein [Mariniblastus fucicola]QEG20616.1 hypothetical protein MFFC18_04660 [Mariniblastus fucicola]
MSSSSHYNRRLRRGGFTLTELLIGITIIGLLVGMLAVVGGGAINRAREFAVTNEITQMSQAIENFKNKYGFYPPTFQTLSQLQDHDSTNQVLIQNEANQVLVYLNKIAPNHQERGLSPIPSRASAGYRRIDDWWQQVGVNLNQQTCLQFWLSGLIQNKQYPLTGGLGLPGTFNASYDPTNDPYIPVAYNSATLCDLDTTDKFNNATIDTYFTVDVARDILFDFDTDRFETFEELDLANPGSHPRNTDPTNSPASNVTAYNLPYHKTNASNGLSAFYAYQDAASYTSEPFAYHSTQVTTGVPSNFANPNTFQLISPGLDSDYGAAATTPLSGFLAAQDKVAIADNICNFTNGRMDKFLDDQQ